ncbi:hypothetical protein PTKIN_Ptkin14bG0170000 [Pterospermum kingtungense]
MQPQNLSFSKTLNPSSFILFPPPKPFLSPSLPSQNHPFSNQSPPILSIHLRDVRAFAVRSKKKPGGQSSGRLEGNAKVEEAAVFKKTSLEPLKVAKVEEAVVCKERTIKATVTKIDDNYMTSHLVATHALT